LCGRWSGRGGSSHSKSTRILGITMNNLTVEGLARSLNLVVDGDDAMGKRKIIVKDEHDKEYEMLYGDTFPDNKTLIFRIREI